MANARIEGFEQLEKFLGRLAEPTKMAIKAVDAAAPILEESLRSEITGAANRGYATGELAASVTATKAKENQYGVYSVVRPVGTKKRKGKNGKEYEVRHAEELAYLEYGTKKGQRSHPVRQKAINTAEAKCADIIEKEIADAVEKLW